MPGLPAMAVRALRVSDLQRAIRARHFHQHGVGLVVVPPKAVAVPTDAVEVQYLRFNPARGARFARLQFQGQGFCQNPIRRKNPLHRAPQILPFVNARRSRKRGQPFRHRAVAPEFRVDGKRDDAGGRRVTFRGGEQARFAQFARKTPAGVRDGVRLELIDSAAVIRDVKLPGVVLAEIA